MDCENLSCTSLGGNCNPVGFGVAEGTPCGGGMVCLAGACVPLSAIPLPVNGGWSDWTETSCSRSCSGGVIIRQRVCNNPAPVWGGAPCVGEGVEFRLCNLNPCLNSPDDFRNEQCAATASVPDTDGNVHEWTQFFALQAGMPTDEYCRNPCLLVGQPLYDFRPPGVNTDGTGCWDYNTADESIILRCVSGTCQVQTGQISLCRFTGFVSLRRWVRGALCAAKWRYQWPRIHLVHDFGPLSQMEARNTR
ncbi:putative A disintegrin and metalloproteinase with thrombospondin motifs 1 [Apostichopus japonicus]|uniref:Putative A disintegrin and metalloproteinase with thrombospondin motifs 1 n=1 Tax=Stichopus japonicus TaxID=307972 RepID=A0A2G8K781_STIJA|nr:putative A disintegrin and metalloproteinase with thrombospondin motifs 1 [Apostichopus japonicus]